MMKVQWNDENHTDFLGNWNQGFEHPFFLKKKKKLESEKKKKKKLLRLHETWWC